MTTVIRGSLCSLHKGILAVALSNECCTWVMEMNAIPGVSPVAGSLVSQRFVCHESVSTTLRGVAV